MFGAGLSKVKTKLALRRWRRNAPSTNGFMQFWFNVYSNDNMDRRPSSNPHVGTIGFWMILQSKPIVLREQLPSTLSHYPSKWAIVSVCKHASHTLEYVTGSPWAWIAHTFTPLFWQTVAWSNFEQYEYWAWTTRRPLSINPSSVWQFWAFIKW